MPPPPSPRRSCNQASWRQKGIGCAQRERVTQDALVSQVWTEEGVGDAGTRDKRTDSSKGIGKGKGEEEAQTQASSCPGPLLALGRLGTKSSEKTPPKKMQRMVNLILPATHSLSLGLGQVTTLSPHPCRLPWFPEPLNPFHSRRHAPESISSGSTDL